MRFVSPLLKHAVYPALHRTGYADCGRGHYANAIRQAAANLHQEGRIARIFSGATNVSFLRGILKAGFQYRFSFLRRTKLGRSIIARRETTTVIAARQL